MLGALILTAAGRYLSPDKEDFAPNVEGAVPSPTSFSLLLNLCDLLLSNKRRHIETCPRHFGSLKTRGLEEARLESSIWMHKEMGQVY